MTISPMSPTGEGALRKRAFALRRFDSAGFTFVELLLAILVLSTAAAVVYPSLSGELETRRFKAAQHDVDDLMGHGQRLYLQGDRELELRWNESRRNLELVRPAATTSAAACGRTSAELVSEPCFMESVLDAKAVPRNAAEATRWKQLERRLQQLLSERQNADEIVIARISLAQVDVDVAGLPIRLAETAGVEGASLRLRTAHHDTVLSIGDWLR